MAKSISELVELINDGKFNFEDDAAVEAAQKVLDAEHTKEWNEFCERRDNFDDAIYTHPWGYDALRRILNLRGETWDWALADLGDNMVKAKIVDGKFGKVWCIEKTDGVEWVNVSTANTIAKEQKFYQSKGYQLAVATYTAKIGSGGRVVNGKFLRIEIAE